MTDDEGVLDFELYLFRYKEIHRNFIHLRHWKTTWRLLNNLRTHTLLIETKIDTKSGAVAVVTDSTGGEPKPGSLHASNQRRRPRQWRFRAERNGIGPNLSGSGSPKEESGRNLRNPA